MRRRVVNRTMEEHVDWNNLPDVIFGDIMMMVGLESLEILHTCRQVCRSWNEMIVSIIQDILIHFINPPFQCEMTDTQKFRKSVGERLRIKLSDNPYLPSNAEISQAKNLGRTVKQKQND